MVESTALEMRRMGNRTVGSNPTLSAILKPLVLRRFSRAGPVPHDFAGANRLPDWERFPKRKLLA